MTREPSRPVILHVRRRLAHVRRPGHPLDGRLVEVTGRGSRRDPGVVYVKVAVGEDPTEYEFRTHEVEEVRS